MHFLCKVPSSVKLPTFLWTTALQHANCLRRGVARLYTVYWLVLVPFIRSLRFEIIVYADRRLSKSAKAFSIAST